MKNFAGKSRFDDFLRLKGKKLVRYILTHGGHVHMVMEGSALGKNRVGRLRLLNKSNGLQIGVAI